MNIRKGLGNDFVFIFLVFFFYLSRKRVFEKQPPSGEETSL